MMQASKVKKFPACRKNFLTLDAQKHEEEAIYEVNERIPNVFRIAGIAQRWSNPWHHGKNKRQKSKSFLLAGKTF